ncbi:MAG: PaREP1 family protein [Caldivirga sp.]|nr:PaREP1 family protein [Caldivirga sp.]
MLSRVSKTLASQLGDWVLDGWNSAYGLHVWAFMRVS